MQPFPPMSNIHKPNTSSDCQGSNGQGGYGTYLIRFRFLWKFVPRAFDKGWTEIGGRFLCFCTGKQVMFIDHLTIWSFGINVHTIRISDSSNHKYGRVEYHSFIFISNRIVPLGMSMVIYTHSVFLLFDDRFFPNQLNEYQRTNYNGWGDIMSLFEYGKIIIH